LFAVIKAYSEHLPLGCRTYPQGVGRIGITVIKLLLPIGFSRFQHSGIVLQLDLPARRILLAEYRARKQYNDDEQHARQGRAPSVSKIQAAFVSGVVAHARAATAFLTCSSEIVPPVAWFVLCGCSAGT
jgi:hypothetical protein